MSIDEKVKDLQRDYYRRWRARPENKAKVKEYSQRYWLKKAWANQTQGVEDKHSDRERH